jgi:O-antigen ligase
VTNKLTQSDGFLHWVLPAMIGLGGLTVLLSGRELSMMFDELQQGGGGYRHPIAVWGQRAVSLLLLAAAGERVLSHMMLGKRIASPLLAWTFITYWLCTVAAPAIFGSHPMLSHEYLYTLIIGFAVIIATPSEREKILLSARTALVLFLLAGVILIPLMPGLVLDLAYKQGLLPGVPRLGGLASHPVALGMFAQTALLLLWARPFQRKWINRLSWMMALGVLFMAQSKTAWFAFLLCSLCMLAVRNGPSLMRRLGDPREGAFGVVMCLGVMVAAATLMGVVLLGNLEGQVMDFFDTAQGAQLMTMTGRDQIWAIAIEEWQASPVFGYGPGLWDDEFRAAINMPNATSAHNQFMDTLARSGSIGAAALVFYALVLLALSIRHAKATGGLSLALFLAVALRAVSEVPLLLFGYGTELFAHLLLLVTIATARSERVEVIPARSRPAAYGTVS